MKQLASVGRRPRTRHPLRCSVEELAKGNHGNHRLARVELEEPLHKLLRLLLTDVNADVRVQQETRVHHNPLRFCGRSFSRSATVRSFGKLASNSNARSIVPFFSRRTISSPRRKISTSSLFRRNCFGSRTAWLFPDRNTRAVPMATSKRIYAKYIRRGMGLQKNVMRDANRNGRYFGVWRGKGVYYGGHGATLNPPSVWRCSLR